MANKKRDPSINGKILHVRGNVYKKPYIRKNGMCANVYYVLVKCGVCGEDYYRHKRNHVKGGTPACSKECKIKLSQNPNGTKRHKRTSTTGPIMVKQRGHPFVNNQDNVPEHRLVVEGSLGRYLKKEEMVHHINMIDDDNRLENLYLCKNMSEHNAVHWSIVKCMKPLLESGVLFFDNENGIYTTENTKHQTE